MANKRKLKKGIDSICEGMIAECISTSIYSNNSDRQNVNTLLETIIKTHIDYIKRVSHPEPGMKAKVYYNTLINNFVNDVNDIVDQIKNLHN